MIVVILAAGLSRRYGGCKVLAEVDGKVMIQRVIDELPSDFQTFVVTGGYREQVEAYLQEQGIPSLFNKDYELGIGTSVRLAAEKAKNLQTDLLITLADLPYLRKQDYERLIGNFNGHEPLFSQFTGGFGPPMIVPKDLVSQLDKVPNHRGAAAIFKSYKLVEIQAASRDIDTPPSL